METNNNQSVYSSMVFSPTTRLPAVSIYFNELIHYKNKSVDKRIPLRRFQPKRDDSALIELS